MFLYTVYCTVPMYLFKVKKLNQQECLCVLAVLRIRLRSDLVLFDQIRIILILAKMAQHQLFCRVEKAINTLGISVPQPFDHEYT
jgi:hypothetical protein